MPRSTYYATTYGMYAAAAAAAAASAAAACHTPHIWAALVAGWRFGVRLNRVVRRCGSPGLGGSQRDELALSTYQPACRRRRPYERDLGAIPVPLLLNRDQPTGELPLAYPQPERAASQKLFSESIEAGEV